MAARKTSPARRFPGFSAAGMAWWRGIARNNDRAWFAAHRDVFEGEVKAATAELALAVAAELASFAPAYVPEDASRCVARIHRDLRFTHDPAPYKTWLTAWFRPRGGGRDDCAGLWFRVGSAGLDVLGGVQRLGAGPRAALRAWLASHHAALERVLRRKALRDALGELQGESLARVPRGVDPGHPAADLLRRTQLYLHAHLPAGVLATPDLQREVVRRFRLLVPFADVLNEALGVP